MKKAFIPVVLIILCIFSACSLEAPEESVDDEQQMVEAAFSANPSGSGKFGKQNHDATDFLVGEFYVSNGYTAYFDGRGSLTMVAPNGKSIGGYYAMEDGDKKNATVLINFGEGETRYSYNLISSEGDFTLSSGKDSMLVFVLKTYE